MTNAAPTATPAEAMPGLKGKNVLVTGGSSGIGQAIAVRFAQYGANVAINYLRQPDEASRHRGAGPAPASTRVAAGRASATCSSRATSPTRTRSCAMVGGAVDGLGGLDVLINNAGIQISRPSAELSERRLRQGASRSTCAASFLCAREAIKHFLAEEKPGVIINVSSVHQLIPKPDYLGYSTSKGGMQNLTRTLALEYAGEGIRVNGIGPGATVTPINRAWIDDPVKRAQVEAHIPMRARRHRRRDGRRWRASWPATTPPTSPARRSSSTAA